MHLERHLQGASCMIASKGSKAAVAASQTVSLGRCAHGEWK